MIDQGWFDAEFVRNWTNGPFLVRDADGTMLRSEIVKAGGEAAGFVAWDERRRRPIAYEIGNRRFAEAPGRLAISGDFVVDTREGPILCRPAFELLAARCRAMAPENAVAVSGIEPNAIEEAARLLWHHRPVAHYTWTGLEQHTNATQTDRAIAILHALTGSIDVPGGNVHFAQVPVNDVSGVEFRDPKQWQKALGWSERPLGPAADGWITSTDLYRAVLDRQPLSGARACRFRGQSAAIAR
jgi:anaerobic selenocysteine-containing dehydrogenase